MADSEEIAFLLQLEELRNGEVERAVRTEEEVNRYCRGDEPLSSLRNYENQKDLENGVPGSAKQLGLPNLKHNAVSSKSAGNESKMKAGASGSARLREATVNYQTLKRLDAPVPFSVRSRTKAGTKEPEAESDGRNEVRALQLEKCRPAAPALRREHSEWRKSIADDEKEAHMLARTYQQISDDELLARLLAAKMMLADEDNQSESASSSYEYQVYNLFFSQMRDDNTPYVGIGCVIKDVDHNVLFENRECLGMDISYHFAEYTALINGLAYARSMGVNHINAHGNTAIVYWEIQGLTESWTTEHVQLMNALQEQVKELSSFSMRYVSKMENEDAINLATYAIAQHVSELSRKGAKPKENSRADPKQKDREECRICFEKVLTPDMVRQEGCEHQFCFNCLTRHVQNEALGDKLPVRCPQFFTCGSHMSVKDCQRLLSPKAFDVYARRLTEATIMDSEKVYCPYPNCSAMMCRTVDETPVCLRVRCFSRSKSAPERSASRGTECMECHRLFCEECQVPWHQGLTCQQYQRLPKDERNAEFIMLSKLAKDENWKRCSKCRRMIILAHGCTHMTCRCGYEFCYTCGADYKDKRRMCECPLFPEKPKTLRRR